MAVDARIIVVVLLLCLLLLAIDAVAPPPDSSSWASVNESSLSSTARVSSLPEMQQQRRSELGETDSNDEGQKHKKKHHCKGSQADKHSCKCKKKQQGWSSPCPYGDGGGWYHSKADLRAECGFGLTIATLILHKLISP